MEMEQWRRQNVKTARLFPGQYGRFRQVISCNLCEGSKMKISVSQGAIKPGQKLFGQGIWPDTP